MKTPLLSVLLLLALVGCSADAPAPTATTAAARDAATAAPRNDPTARARLGIVFADSDPWMAGAVIEHGRIHVGDRLFLSTDNNTHILVTITAIRDDATQADVTEAAAPQGVFLSFKPIDTRSLPKNLGNAQTLVTDPAQADETMVVNSGSAAHDH